MLLCTVGARPARAQEPPQWSAELTSQRAPITNNGVDATWATDGAQTTWVLPGRAGWSLAVQRQRRYGFIDATAFTEGYFRTRNWTVLGAVGGTPNADFMYRVTAGGEISRRIVNTKQSLVRLGRGPATALVAYLSHPDRFARNSAAEVLQDVGEFERLLLLETEGTSDPVRLETLRRLAAAGGTGMCDAVVARLPVDARDRGETILAGLALETAG
jgi:hypothetical protein